MKDIPPSEFFIGMVPCEVGYEFAIRYAWMSEVWVACERPDWLLWLIRRTLMPTHYQTVEILVSVAETVQDRSHPLLAAARAWLEEPSEASSLVARNLADDMMLKEPVSPAYVAALAAGYPVSAFSYLSAIVRIAGLTTDSPVYTKQCDIIRSFLPNPFL